MYYILKDVEDADGQTIPKTLFYAVRDMGSDGMEPGPYFYSEIEAQMWAFQNWVV